MSIESSKRSGAVTIASAAAFLAVARAASGQTALALPNNATADPQFAMPTLPLGMMMQRTGGSLMRAELASQAPPPKDPAIGGGGLDPAAASDPNTPEAANGGNTGSAGGAGAQTVSAISFFTVADAPAKKLKKHDLITIIVKENATFSASGEANLQHQTDIDAKLDAFVALHLSKWRLDGIIPGGAGGIPEVKTELTRDMDNQATVDRTDSVSERITAEVVDVKPNGNIVLQAIKYIKNDDEETRMVLTGTCRVQDVGSDNSVLSTQLYDLEMTQSHKGMVNETTRRGLIPRLLDQVNPF